MKRTVAILILLSTPAFAEEPTWEAKRDALMQAYVLNGNSMVGWGISELPPKPVKTDKIKVPIVNATEKNELDSGADNVCEKHHLRKIQFRKRWRCRR